MKAFATIVAYICVLLGAYAAVGYIDERADGREQYVKELEKTLGKCLATSYGLPITIGGEVYMCGATSIGVKL